MERKNGLKRGKGLLEFKHNVETSVGVNKGEEKKREKKREKRGKEARKGRKRSGWECANGWWLEKVYATEDHGNKPDGLLNRVFSIQSHQHTLPLHHYTLSICPFVPMLSSQCKFIYINI
jgi:hypothetical protein